MNCDNAKQQLSRYFDGELSGAATAKVQAHVQTCPDCQAELASFEKLSVTLSAPASRAAPPWSAIQASLATRSSTVSLAQQETTAADRENPRSKLFKDAFIIAASLAASVLILAWTLPQGDGTSQMAQTRSPQPGDVASAVPSPPHQGGIASSRAHSGHNDGTQHGHVHDAGGVSVVDLHDTFKLHTLGTDAAIQNLATRYNGRVASGSEVVKEFGRQPSIQSILPSSVKLVSTQLLEMPQCDCAEGECTCGPGKCNCVASVCQRPDGTTFLVIEQCRGQDVSFGDASSQLVRHGDRELTVGKSGDTIAVSWQAPSGRLTAFGLNSLEELNQMLAMR